MPEFREVHKLNQVQTTFYVFLKIKTIMNDMVTDRFMIFDPLKDSLIKHTHQNNEYCM